ncbi:hypothetical protein RBSWK_01048 [Rhodopirellula baltica SWK14]|uniref:Uncharacterized protein n=1 Tax=Rhodopirellula baltica SWK14 TaxID=993516 RepID=L7CM67_RHOBT|nr:hypothetical protein RBSWK_01048 [Rhodopirellula baltica SWK14]
MNRLRGVHQHFDIAQPVVKDDLAILQAFASAECQQSGVAGSCPHQCDESRRCFRKSKFRIQGVEAFSR